MQRSKQSEFESVITREVPFALAEIALEYPDLAALIKQHRSCIGRRIARHLTERYRFLEIADIMAWKTRRVDR